MLKAPTRTVVLICDKKYELGFIAFLENSTAVPCSCGAVTLHQAAKALHAKEQLLQELRQQEQRQREETRALLEEKEEALNESLSAQQLQHDLVQQMRRQQEGRKYALFVLLPYRAMLVP